ncbi:MAG: nitroreductase family protein [Thermoplasmata archaeon]
MDVLEAMKERKSVRKYKPMPLSAQQIQKIFNAVRMAPSVDNLQPWRFIIVNDEDLKRSLAAASSNQKWIAEAPLVVVACGLLDEAQGMIGGFMNSYPVDVALAMAYLTLAAHNEGLGTCWVNAFNEEKVRSVVGAPLDVKVVALTPLGVPDGDPEPSGRKHLNEIVCYNKYE